ncbi:cob(I)yrinic acid a,c-diamide adenosyltransferase [Chloroflexota bacterium]
MKEKSSANNLSFSEPLNRGLVQVFTGDGKGKTSAALGVVLRAVGEGLRVYVVFFMKGDYPYGEFRMLPKLPNVHMDRFGFRTFTDPADVQPEEKEQAKQALAAAREAMLSGNYDMVVLDEINLAVAWNLVELDKVARLVNDKPENVELVLTGRYANKEIIRLADLVTECLKIKHPFDDGVFARRGIEY